MYFSNVRCGVFVRMGVDKHVLCFMKINYTSKFIVNKILGNTAMLIYLHIISGRFGTTKIEVELF